MPFIAIYEVISRDFAVQQPCVEIFLKAGSFIRFRSKNSSMPETTTVHWSMHWSLVFILLVTNVLKKKSEIIHRIRLQPMNRDVGFYSSSTASIFIHSPCNQ